MFTTIKTLNGKIIRLNIESIILMDYGTFYQIGSSGFVFDINENDFQKITKLTQHINVSKLNITDYLNNGMIDEFYKI